VSIGGTLAQARREAGLTIAQVSQRTKIREIIISGIEQDDFSACGADFYARGHIRSIARAVGADPDPLIAEYDAARLAEEQAAAGDAVTLPDLAASGLAARAPGSPQAGSAAGGDPPSGWHRPRRVAAGYAPETREAAGYAPETWETAGYHPAAGEPSGYHPATREPGGYAAAGPRTGYRSPAQQSGPLPVGRWAPVEPGGPPAPGRPRDSRRRLNLTAIVVLGLVVVFAIVAFYLRAATHTPTARNAAAGTGNRAAQHRTGHRSHRAASGGSAGPARPAARALHPVSAIDFGIQGAGQGDDPQSAMLAIDGNPATAWHTDWYTTARFGNLYSGTGLLLNMGRTVTIRTVRVRLGAARGTSFEVRVGNVPALADLRPVARATDTAGLVRLRPAAPARGRYVLIWLTRLPPDRNGTFQASIYGVTLRGQR
jgi:transcriptional regulator with XRE-family HTH domain